MLNFKQHSTLLGREMDPQVTVRKLKSDHTTKWYTQKPESVRENETQKIHWHFHLWMDHLKPARSQDLLLINKKKICDFFFCSSGKR